MEKENELKNYYELKQKYEKNKAASVNKILNNPDYTKKEQQEKIEVLKAKCVKCKRNVNTIFSVDDNNYIAICGSKETPCKLNMSVQRKHIGQLRDLIKEMNDSLDTIKQEITQIKLDFLFKYTNEDETVIAFEEKKELLKTTNEIIFELRNELAANLNNNERNENINEKTIELNRTIDKIKKNVNIYRQTMNKGVLKENALIVKDLIYPTQNILRNLKYDISMVDKKAEKFYLYQVKDSIQKTEKEIPM